MSVNLRYPNITGLSEKEQLSQIKSYMHQLVDQLNYALPNLKGTDQTTSAQSNDTSSDDLRYLLVQEIQEVEDSFEKLADKMEKEYVRDDEVSTIIEPALALAKESGEFDGYTPVKGVDYFDGKPGYTPVKGTDYWTEADIQEMVTETVNAVLKEKDSFLQASYPVGSIYISAVSTNPNTLFGFGTWEQLKDTFLLAAGDTYEAGATGGEAEHTLTVDEMPSHTHGATGVNDGAGTSGQSGNYPIRIYQDKAGNWPVTGIQYTGGSKAHNNMPPYLAVYVWKRTA